MSTPTPTSAATAVVRRRYGRCLAADMFSPRYRSLAPSPGGRGVVRPPGAHARRVVLPRAGQVVRSPAPPGRAPAGAPGVADPPPAAPAGPPGADTAPPPGRPGGPPRGVVSAAGGRGRG